MSSGLAAWQSARTHDVACVLSVSSSKFSDWTESGSSLMEQNRFGAAQGVYRYDAKSDRAVGKIDFVETKNLNWSLPAVIAHPESVCGDAKGFDELVVQLGTNESAKNFDLARYEKVLKLAQGKISKVHFVLAPRNKNQSFAPFNKSAVEGIPALAKKYPNIAVDVFDSQSVELKDSDFRKDGDHIWGSPGERRWLEGIKNHLSGGFASEDSKDAHVK